MEKSVVPGGPSKGHRRIFSIFRSKKHRAIQETKDEYEDQVAPRLEDAPEDGKSKIRRLLGPWKSLFRVFTKNKRQLIALTPQSISLTEILPGNKIDVTDTTNVAKDLANLAMAITLPGNMTGKDIKVDIELNAKPIGTNCSSKLVIKERKNKCSVYSGNIRVPSMTTIEDLSKMSFFLLNATSTDSEYKIETVIKPKNIFPEINDRSMLINDISLNLNIRSNNTNCENPNELPYTFIQNGFAKKSIEAIHVEEILDTITDTALNAYHLQAKLLVKEILNQIINKVTLEQDSSTSNIVKIFNQELEIQKQLLMERSSTTFEYSDSQSSDTQDVSDTKICDSNEMIIESESKVILMAPSNTPELCMPNPVVNETMTNIIDDVFSSKHWPHNKTIRDEVKANIDQTLQLLEKAKHKLLSYLNEPLVNEACYEVADSFRSIVAMAATNPAQPLNYDFQEIPSFNSFEIGTNCGNTLYKQCPNHELNNESEEILSSEYKYDPNWTEIDYSNLSKPKDYITSNPEDNNNNYNLLRPSSLKLLQEIYENDLKDIAKPKKRRGQLDQSIENIFETENIVSESVTKTKSLNSGEFISKSCYCDPFLICGFLDNDCVNFEAALTRDQHEILEEYRYHSVNDDVFAKRYKDKTIINELPSHVIQNDKEIMMREILNESMHIRDIIIAAVGDFIDADQAENPKIKVREDIHHILSLLLHKVEEQCTLKKYLTNVDYPQIPKVYQVYPVYFCLIDDYVDVFPSASGSTSSTTRINYGINTIPKLHQGRATTISAKRQYNRNLGFQALQNNDELVSNLEKGINFLSELYKEIYTSPRSFKQYTPKSNTHTTSKKHRSPYSEYKNKNNKVTNYTGKEIVEYIMKCKKMECKYPLSGGGLIAWQKHWVDLLACPFTCDLDLVLGHHLPHVIKCDHIVQMAKKAKQSIEYNRQFLKPSKNPTLPPSINNSCNKSLSFYSSEEIETLINATYVNDIKLEENTKQEQENLEFNKPAINPKRSFKNLHDSYDPYAASTSSYYNEEIFLHEINSRATIQSMECNDIFATASDKTAKHFRPVADIPRRFASSYDEFKYWQNLKVIHRNVFEGKNTASTSSSEPESSNAKAKVVYRIKTVSDINLVENPDAGSQSSSSISSFAKSADYEADTEMLESIMPNFKLVYVSKQELNEPEEILKIEANVRRNDILNPDERRINSRDFEDAQIRRLKSLIITSSESSSISLKSETDIGVDENVTTTKL